VSYLLVFAACFVCGTIGFEVGLHRGRRNLQEQMRGPARMHVVRGKR
jgi:hypothetical protein